jgi:Recombinase
VLKPGEQKSIATDRVILVPGPPEEIEIVRRIYSSFVNDRKTETGIAAVLNGQGIKNAQGRAWSHNAIHRILKNEKYIGNNVWNIQSFKLKQKRVRNSPEAWLR